MNDVAHPDSELAEVEYNLDVQGLQLVQPFMWAPKKSGDARIVFATLREVKTGEVFVGEGPGVVDAVNAAYHKARSSGLRNSRLS